MLTAEQSFVLLLLRRALINDTIEVDVGGLNVNEVVRIVRLSGLLLTVYPQMAALPEAQSSLALEYYASVAQNVNQVHEARRILTAFDTARVPCMGLKGWDVRELYPHAAMRQMADIDVLVRPYDYTTVREVMASLGFTSLGDESSWMHDNFCKGSVTVEVHKRLTDDSACVREWESRMWERALVNHGCVRSMTPEDVYLYHLVHMHKDFLGGELGLRRLVDLWLLERGWDALDGHYVGRELESMAIAEFRVRMSRLSRVVMGMAEPDSDAELLLAHAFKHGIYGSSMSYKAARIARMSRGGLASGKVRSAVAAVFLPYDRMKAHFPELERRPWLLPACWAKRIARFARSSNLRHYRQMLDYGDVSAADLHEMRRFFEAGGC